MKPNFLIDHQLVRAFTPRERAKIYTALQDIQNYCDNHIKTEEDFAIANMDSYLNNSSMSYNIFRNPVKLEILRREVYNKLKDWGKGRRGTKSGLVSRSLPVEYNELTRVHSFKKNWDKSTDDSYPNIEHIFPINFSRDVIIQDYIKGMWKFEDGVLTIGKDYVENFYPYFVFSIWTTKKENQDLKVYVERLINENTDDRGIIDTEKVLEEVMNAKHYENCDITLYKEVMNINFGQVKNGEIFYNEVPEGFKNLQKHRKVFKKKVKKNKDKLDITNFF
jgi:hypothetical protein|tara:strand:+ start:1702 stop:2535 length:834 start_codon:yes stop_codon:yes gene_type:complete